VRAAIADLPAPMRQLIVLRDVQGRSADEVREVTGVGPDQQLAMLLSARSVVRGQLERVLEPKEAAS
jgi:DNA-directed RNA polymerase specialized sigma24 family protein